MTLDQSQPKSTAAAAPLSGRLTFLDGWRALAVTIVIASHVTGFRHDPLVLKQLARWLPAGEVGVLIFFFISGFVITRSALVEIDRTADFSIPAFYTRRAFRIIPPLVLYLVTCLCLGALGIVDFRPGNALPAFLYVCNVGVFDHCIWLGGHTWSLAFEEQFYLLFPILLSFLLLHRRPFMPHLVAALIFCALPLVSPLSDSRWFSFVQVYGLFAAGVLAARHEEALASALRNYAGLIFAVTAGLVFVVTPLTLWWAPIADNYPVTFIVSIPAMVLCSGWTMASRLLNNGILRYVGRISYSIYLWQELATSDLFRHQSLAVELIALAGVVALCAILFEVMEKPLIRLGHRLSQLPPVRRMQQGSPG